VATHMDAQAGDVDMTCFDVFSFLSLRDLLFPVLNF